MPRALKWVNQSKRQQKPDDVWLQANTETHEYQVARYWSSETDGGLYAVHRLRDRVQEKEILEFDNVRAAMRWCEMHYLTGA